MSWILTRLREPSTYAGFAGLALAVGISSADWATISAAIAAVAGVIAMFISETPANDQAL